MKILKLILKILFGPPLLVIILVSGLITFFYLSSRIYIFPAGSSFKGEYWYNPYEGLDSNHWHKYNFQVQSKAWWGLTDGRENTNELIEHTYHSLGYDYTATSDYMIINRYGSGKPEYIPTYEHGYGINKTHQICVGSQWVNWRDYPLFQTLSMKQDIIDRLRPSTDLLVLAHPPLRQGYDTADFTKLGRYDLIEVLNNLRIALPHWDSALSSGHPAFIMANDDAHDVTNTNEVGRRFTMINATYNNRNEIIESLKHGRAYGYDFIRHDDEPIQTKIERSKTIAGLQRVSISHDTLKVEVDGQVKEFRFIGQGGLVKHADSAGSYLLTDEDTYIRTEIELADSSRIYLNPVIRFNGSKISSSLEPRIDERATFIKRFIAFSAFLLIFVYLLARKKKF